MTMDDRSKLRRLLISLASPAALVNPDPYAEN
jgi:hypothetical protein